MVKLTDLPALPGAPSGAEQVPMVLGGVTYRGMIGALVAALGQPFVDELEYLIAQDREITDATQLIAGAAAVAARQSVLIDCEVAGEVALEVGGIALLLPVNPGITILPLAVTRYFSSGSAVADCWNLTISQRCYTAAALLAPGAAAIPARRAVLIACTGAGKASFTLAGGGTLIIPLSPGTSLIELAATRLNTSGTTAALTAWSLA